MPPEDRGLSWSDRLERDGGEDGDAKDDGVEGSRKEELMSQRAPKTLPSMRGTGMHD